MEESGGGGGGGLKEQRENCLYVAISAINLLLDLQFKPLSAPITSIN